MEKQKQEYRGTNVRIVGQTFTITDKTIFYSAKKDASTYQKYIHLMMEGASLRKCQKECGISLRTSFLWRQKILDTFQNIMDKIVLNGVVEMDETFFDISYKGSRKIPRKPHKRGGSVSTRGISKHKVCVNPVSNNRITSDMLFGTLRLYE